MPSIACSRVPTRLSLIGGGTDLPPFIHSEGGGLSISINTNLYIYTTAKYHTDLFRERYRLSYSQSELCDSVHEIKNNIARGVLTYLSWDVPLFISTVSDIPESCGLSSSSAFALGLLNSLYTLLEKPTDPYQIALDAFNVESTVLSRRSGYQDHFSCAFGGFNLLEYQSIDVNNVLVKRCVLPHQTSIQDSLMGSLMLVYLGDRKMPTYMDNPTISSTSSYQIREVYQRSCSVRDQLIKGATLESAGFYETIASLWEFKKLSLVNDSCYGAIIEIEERLKNYPIKCLRMCGAGGGGFLLVIADPCTIMDASEDLGKSYQVTCPGIDCSGITTTFSY